MAASDLPSLLGAAQAATGRAAPKLRDLVKDNQSPDQDDANWYQGVRAEDAVRWDQQFPYQLLVVTRSPTGGWSPVRGWQFTLPIPPQAIEVTTPFAATADLTMGGVVEEFSGAPVRSITMSGTMGMLPFRPAAGQRGSFGALETVLTGTVRAGATTLASFRQLISSDASGKPITTLNVLSDDEASEQQVLSGFYQWQLLRKFMEDYAKFRTTEKGRGCTLAYAEWKSRAVWLCTPVALSNPRQAGLEYRWSLQLRAWRRVSLEGQDGGAALRSAIDPSRRDVSALTRALNEIQDARLVLQGARSTLEAVGGDVDRAVFEPLRECALLLKDLVALPLALADLPGTVARDARDSILQLLAARQDVVDAGALTDARLARSKKDLDSLRDLLSGEVKDQRSAVTAVGDLATGTTITVTGTTQGAPTTGATPGLDVLARPERHYELFSQVNLSRLQLPRRAQEAVAAERLRVSRLRRKDLNDRRKAVVQAGAAFADAVGAGDTTFSATYGLNAPRSVKDLSRANLRVIQALNAAAGAIAHLAAFGRAAAEDPFVTTFEQMAQRAADSNVSIRVPRSKFPVPLPYGVTLERLAAAYLGDPGRAAEIAALNNLREPFVDEVGWRKALLTPAQGSTIVVADADSLAIGQTVWLTGLTLSAVRRRVVSISVTPGQVAVTLDGDDDLTAYTPTTGAVLQGFLPGTVNSQQLVFIPSDLPPDGSFRVTGVPDAAAFGSLASVGGVDLLLTPTNDLVVTPDGDGRWAVGMTNLTQQFRLTLGTRRGELLEHPGFGLGLRPGESTSDLSVADVASAVRAALSGDPAFRAVRQIELRKAGPVVQLAIQAELANTSIALPLSVDLV